MPVGSDCDGMEAVTCSPPVRPRAAIRMINMHQMHPDQCSASAPSPLGATFATRRSGVRIPLAPPIGKAL